ncbi:MAG: hypothetical protein EXR71_19085 [Myxococcales bacterium]|nr:hypothetical protein [Myxococcales bacterium]
MLWTDGVRMRNAAVAVAGLVLLGAWYAHRAMGLEIGWREYSSDPEKYDGAPLTFPLWSVTRIVDARHYEISKVVKDVPVEGDATRLDVGDAVSVVADFSASKHVAVARIVELHPLRPWKEGLGVAGIFAWFLAMPFLYRIRGRRVEERGRG